MSTHWKIAMLNYKVQLFFFLYFGGEYVTISVIFSSLFKASTHLIWSVFGLTNPETMESRDNLSTAVASVLFVLFLILSVIMLVNMLVALLTNTYNKVEVSSYLHRLLYPTPESYEHFNFSQNNSLLMSVLTFWVISIRLLTVLQASDYIRIDSVQTFKGILKNLAALSF